ncbi:MAG: tetratricopeptide repeat protein [Candidatus Hydrogenedentes bacterium]|nr:tetratricopeptide repeat protein [Candidatus Hydrogenedentota bacterium]
MRNTFQSTTWALLVLALCGCSATPAAGFETAPHWRQSEAPNEKARAIAHYLSAIIYAGQGKEAESIEEMARVPELDPGAVTPMEQLIRGYLREEKYDEALKVCEKAVAQRPDQAVLHIVLGQIYHQLGRLDDAMEAFNTAIRLEPDNVMGYGALVDLQESRNDLTAAVGVYERLIELSPESAGLYYQLALVLIRINDKEGAIEALRKTIELNPRLVRARYLLGVVHLEANQIEECIAQLRAYMQERPNDMDAVDNLAGAQARAGRFEQAIALFQRILSSNQVQPQHHIASMYLHLRAKRFDEVAALSPPEGAPYFEMLFRAIAQAERGEFPELLEKSIESTEGDLDTECGVYLNNLIYLFGQQDTGQWIYDAVSKLAERANSRVLHIIRARTLMAMENHADAVPVLDHVLANFTPDKWVHYYLAICHEELDHFEETERHLKAYLEFSPDEPDILNFLAYLYAEEGVKLDQAIDLLNRALAADPENPYYLDSLGWAFYKQGRAEEAVDHIQRAIYGMDKDDAILRDHLGDAYLLRGDVEAALGEWRRALRLDPKMPGLQEKLDRHQP